MIGKKMRRMPFAISYNSEWHSSHLLYKIACLYDWKEDEKNAIRYYRKYMATVSEDQRYALDEDGNPVEDRITLYQQAWKRIKKIKEEGFFRGDIPTKSFPVEKKDTLALRHAK